MLLKVIRVLWPNCKSGVYKEQASDHMGSLSPDRCLSSWGHSGLSFAMDATLCVDLHPRLVWWATLEIKADESSQLPRSFLEILSFVRFSSLFVGPSRLAPFTWRTPSLVRTTWHFKWNTLCQHAFLIAWIYLRKCDGGTYRRNYTKTSRSCDLIVWNHLFRFWICNVRMNVLLQKTNSFNYRWWVSIDTVMNKPPLGPLSYNELI